MNKRTPEEFYAYQTNTWHKLDRMMPYIEEMRRIRTAKRQLRVYFVVVLIIAAIGDFIGNIYMTLITFCFMGHWGFLYYKNHKRLEQYEKDARPITREYQEYMNNRADIAGVERPYKKLIEPIQEN